jgi:hypothetical protein
MNRVIILCVAVLTAGIMHAQIPNPGFETWVSGVPSGWDSVGAAVPGSIEQSSTAHGGSSAARGNVVSLLGFTLPPLLYAGDDGQGFPVSQRHGTLSGFYQFNQVGGDIFYVTVGMLQAGSPIGAGVFVTGANQASYAQFDVPISYVAGGNPDTCYIWITILDTASGFPHLGSSPRWTIPLRYRGNLPSGRIIQILSIRRRALRLRSPRRRSCLCGFSTSWGERLEPSYLKNSGRAYIPVSGTLQVIRQASIIILSGPATSRLPGSLSW